MTPKFIFQLAFICLVIGGCLADNVYNSQKRSTPPNSPDENVDNLITRFQNLLHPSLTGNVGAQLHFMNNNMDVLQQLSPYIVTLASNPHDSNTLRQITNILHTTRGQRLLDDWAQASQHRDCGSLTMSQVMEMRELINRETEENFWGFPKSLRAVHGQFVKELVGALHAWTYNIDDLPTIAQTLSLVCSPRGAAFLRDYVGGERI